jgi:enediyne biosynthesis protein E4
VSARPIAIALLSAALLPMATRFPLVANDAPPFRLTDITARAGLRFVQHTGAFGRKFLPETLGAGAAFLDYDADGRQDVLLVNGADWPGRAVRPDATTRLFRNTGNGTFVDATETAGLKMSLYGMGVAAADYDNDGWQDILITAVGQSRLFSNNRGRFIDATTAAGLGGRTAFSTSALWFDYDRDGDVDLLICNYVRWSPETDLFCSADGKAKSYCTPEAYQGATSWLFQNRGDGTFADVTASAGLFDPTSKSLGATMLDYDQDGWPDLFVANDTQPNKLYRNTRNGRFVETAAQAGLAFSEDGKARAGMGTDAADFDNSGLPSVVVTNFSGEMLGLYTPLGRGQYTDQAPGSEVGRATRLTLGFGCFFFDVDLDSLLDLLVVNGHIDDTVSASGRRVHSAEPPHLFHNRGGRKFLDVASLVGKEFAAPKVGRGAAFADVDLDGDLDVLVTTNGGPAYLYQNELLAEHNAIRLTLRGRRSNRDALGTRVRARVGPSQVTRIVRTGSSYLSQSELPLTLGLGRNTRAERVTLEWPSGAKDEIGVLEAGRAYVVTEGTGVTDTKPLRHRSAPLRFKSPETRR